MHGFAEALRAHPDYFLHSALHAAVELGLPEKLQVPRSLEALADENRWSHPRLQALLRAAQDLAWVREAPTGWWQWQHLGPLPPPPIRQHWGCLAEVIVSDRPVDVADHQEAYQRSMALAHGPAATAWAQRWAATLPAQGHVLDVGAGLGTWSLALVTALEPWHATQVDREPLADLAGTHPRVQRCVADAAALPSLPRADLAIAAHLLHHLGDEDCERCLQQLRLAVRPGGWISIVEVFELDGQPSPSVARWFDLDMALYSPAGRVRPLDEVLAFLARAGCPNPMWRLVDAAASVAEVYGQVTSDET